MTTCLKLLLHPMLSQSKKPLTWHFRLIILLSTISIWYSKYYYNYIPTVIYTNVYIRWRRWNKFTDYILQGKNATYLVSLESTSTEHNFIQPFTVIPNKGYQESNFTITISDINLLDYEVEAWQKFTITVSKTIQSHFDTSSRTIYIYMYISPTPP